MDIKGLADERVFAEVKYLCYQSIDPATLLREVVERLGNAVPFDFYNAVTIDPLSGLPTSFVTSEAVGGEEGPRLFLKHMYSEGGIKRFDWMVKNRIPVTLFSEATDGKLERALDQGALMGPNGFGHELRSIFTTNRALWGGMCISRKRGHPDFDEREVALIDQIAPHLGAGLRASVLREQAQPNPNDDEASGILILDPRGQVVGYTAAAVRWLRGLDNLKGEGSDLKPGWQEGDGLPTAVWSVMGALRWALMPETNRDTSSIPRLCIRARSGRWLTLQASLTGPYPDRPVETAVVITPAGPREVIGLHATAYGLSSREKEVIDLVVRGYSTRQISTVLYISKNTVQNHLSSVFQKVGVRSRRELLKRFFLDNLLPKALAFAQAVFWFSASDFC